MQFIGSILPLFSTVVLTLTVLFINPTSCFKHFSSLWVRGIFEMVFFYYM